MTELFRGLVAWVVANPGWAYLVVFLLAFTESLAVVGLVVPAVLLMFAAGAMIATGALAFWPACLAAIAGAIAGDALSYWLGRRLQQRVREVWPFRRYPQSLAAGERFFARYGGKSVVLGRFIGPIRAVIPLVAGMMKMPRRRFFAANVLSALVWAPAYLLPGMVFGASLELAAEAGVRLVLLLVVLLLGLWLVAWAVMQIFLLFSPSAGRWIEALLRWAEVHPRLGEIARALADPNHPDARTLAGLAAVLILATLLFALAAGVAAAGAPSLALNRAALDLALSLHTPAADHLMAGLSRLGDLGVTLPLLAALYAWLRWWHRGRQAGYWLAAGAFALLATPLLQALLQVPRPEMGLGGLTPWSFPSGHVLRATIFYGLLAVSLAGCLGLAWRWVPYVAAALAITAVAVARLYFGAHWLTDVLGSLALGLAWVAALGLALRRHAAAAPSPAALAGLAFSAVGLAFIAQSVVFHDSDLARYRPHPALVSISDAQWLAETWMSLPQRRLDLGQSNRQRLDLQYAGDPVDLVEALGAKGWRPPEALGWGNAMRLLSPSLPLAELPVVPQVHDGRHESLQLVKDLAADRRLVLRLWDSRYRLGDGQTPLWVGSITAQGKRVLLDLLVIPVTEPDTDGPLAALLADISGFGAVRPAGERGPVLLRLPPPVLGAGAAPGRR